MRSNCSIHTWCEVGGQSKVSKKRSSDEGDFVARRIFMVLDPCAQPHYHDNISPLPKLHWDQLGVNKTGRVATRGQ